MTIYVVNLFKLTKFVCKYSRWCWGWLVEDVPVENNSTESFEIKYPLLFFPQDLQPCTQSVYYFLCLILNLR